MSTKLSLILSGKDVKIRHYIHGNFSDTQNRNFGQLYNLVSLSFSMNTHCSVMSINEKKIYISDVPASAMYFGSYEIIQRALVPEGGDRSEISIGRTIFAGGMAGIFNWMVALPPDVVKSRLQSGMRNFTL